MLKKIRLNGVRSIFVCALAILIVCVSPLSPASAENTAKTLPGQLADQEPPYKVVDSSGTKNNEGLDLTTYRDNSFDAYMAALAAGKYTIILFETDLCVFCENLAGFLKDKQLAKYASVAVVSITHGDRDEGARQLEEALGVVRYPTLVVLRTNSENIHVTGRIEGEVVVGDIDRVLFKATRQPISPQ